MVGELVQSTGLTRRTIVEMLKGVNHATFHQFKLNPEEFIIKAGRIINDCKAISLIQHIQYEKCAGTFGTGIFEEATLRGTLGKNAIESTKSLYDLVVVDSEGIEKSLPSRWKLRMMWWYIANCPVDSTSTLRWANIIPTGL